MKYVDEPVRNIIPEADLPLAAQAGTRDSAWTWRVIMICIQHTYAIANKVVLIFSSLSLASSLSSVKATTFPCSIARAI